MDLFFFFSCELLSHSSLGEKTSKVPSVASDGEFWTSKVLKTIKRLEKDKGHVEFLAESAEENEAMHSKVREISEGLRKVWLIFLVFFDFFNLLEL